MLPVTPALRAPATRDAKAVAALLRAREAIDLGREETTATDVRTEWAGLDLERDAWVLADEEGDALAYAAVDGADLVVAVHPEATRRGLGTELRERAERHARARGCRVVRQFVPSAATAARAHLLGAGWWPAHHYYRMRIDLKHAPPPPAVLARTFDRERDAEEVYHLVQGALAPIEGNLPMSLESWCATGPDKAGWEPAFWLLLHDARGLAGVALGERGGKGETRTGLITTVAVADRARGRGHGRALVALLLEAFRAEKLRAAEAAVHGPTVAAARVFEAVGMVAARRTERWEKVLV